MLLACLAISACQEVEEPLNTIPTVKTDAVKKLSTRFAYLTGTVSSRARCYFLISTSEELAEARRVEAYAHLDEQAGLYTCSCEVGDLQPGTTYYVALCATDERSEVQGNTVSFRTIDNIRIETVEYTKWNGEEILLQDGAIGTFAFYTDPEQWMGDRFGNMETRYDGSAWALPHEILPSDRGVQIYAYYPYNKQVSMDGWEGVPVSVYDETECLYGAGTVANTQNPRVNITLKHAMARLVFSITKEKGSDFAEELTRASLTEKYSCKFLPAWGSLNIITGEIRPSYKENDGIYRNCGFVPETDKAQPIEFLVIPGKIEEGYVTFQVENEQIRFYVTLPEITWEGGKSYEYPIEIVGNSLHIGNVRVEEWKNNESGDITINQ